RVAMLLALTDETSSVRLACQRMQLSYSSGWNAINLLEAELGYPVVARTQGGQRGGRSSLTEKGRALLRAYEAYTLRLRAMADELFVQYFPDLFK
ncbi:MAG: winged helix-turn-helix domain-containing protein, partial [Oscillospiraceae bacterium]